MLAGDVAALDALLDEELLFLGPAGVVVGKNEDLDNYRSGRQRMVKIEVRERTVKTFGAVAVATTLADLEVVFDGTPLAGRFRYLRTWCGGRVIGGAVAPAT